MKLIIAGSRGIKSLETIRRALKFSKILKKDITEIVSGKARGVDSLGEEIAAIHGIKVKEFPANWDMYGKRAGYLRNDQMANYADILLAVWDGKSKGTKHMIDLMRKRNKTVVIYQEEKC
jgi:hypothetical protein